MTAAPEPADEAAEFEAPRPDPAGDVPEPEADAKPVPEADAKPEPEAEVRPAPDADAEREPDTEPKPAPAEKPALPEEGEVLFYEPGGSWTMVIAAGLLIVAVLVMEILGKGQVHWPVLSIFFVILVGFGALQRAAARLHVTVKLTETTLRQGAQTIALTDIAQVYPENRAAEHQKWESARALGELPAVPRRRKGVGVKLTDGKLAQAWARDVDRFRDELTEAHLAVKLGLEPKKKG